MEIKNSISRFIQKGQIDDALEFLNRLRVREFETDISLMIASFNDLKKAERNGIIDFDIASRKKNVLRKDILNLTDEIEKHKNSQKGISEKNFQIKKGNELVPFDVSIENQNFEFHKDSYFERDYLDDELKYSVLFNQNVIVVGVGGSGKSKAIEELTKRYLTKYSIVLPRIDIEDTNDFNQLMEINRAVVIYDELDFYIMQTNVDKHIEAISKIAMLNNLSILANIRTDNLNLFKELLSKEVSSTFKIIEIKPVKREESK